MSLSRTKPRILLADDDAMVRNVVRTCLDRSGYSVLTATNGEEAVKQSKADPERIDILLTDVDMPKTDGLSAFRRIRSARPDIRVLFMSGGGILSQLSLPEPPPFLPKPFSVKALRAKLLEVLQDQRAESTSWLKVILLVDQNVTRRERTRYILNNQGYAVLTADSPEKAEALAATVATIDLIISEVVFGAQTGVDLAEHMMASKREIQTLLISHAGQEVLEGISGFTKQPEFLRNFFTEDELVTRVRTLLRDTSERGI